MRIDRRLLQGKLGEHELFGGSVLCGGTFYFQSLTARPGARTKGQGLVRWRALRGHGQRAREKGQGDEQKCAVDSELQYQNAKGKVKKEWATEGERDEKEKEREKKNEGTQLSCL